MQHRSNIKVWCNIWLGTYSAGCLLRDLEIGQSENLHFRSPLVPPVILYIQILGIHGDYTADSDYQLSSEAEISPPVKVTRPPQPTTVHHKTANTLILS